MNLITTALLLVNAMMTTLPVVDESLVVETVVVITETPLFAINHTPVNLVGNISTIEVASFVGEPSFELTNIITAVTPFDERSAPFYGKTSVNANILFCLAFFAACYLFKTLLQAFFHGCFVRKQVLRKQGRTTLKEIAPLSKDNKNCDKNCDTTVPLLSSLQRALLAGKECNAAKNTINADIDDVCNDFAATTLEETAPLSNDNENRDKNNKNRGKNNENRNKNRDTTVPPLSSLQRALLAERERNAAKNTINAKIDNICNDFAAMTLEETVPLPNDRNRDTMVLPLSSLQRALLAGREYDAMDELCDRFESWTPFSDQMDEDAGKKKWKIVGKKWKIVGRVDDRHREELERLSSRRRFVGFLGVD